MVGGRKIPWWLIGCSTSAEQLNTSNMLFETRRVREDGLAGLWLTWSWILMLIVQNIWFFRLFRRARFLTPMEFYRARYAGKPADFARVYDTAILGVFVGTIWAAIGLVGMKKIGLVLFGLPPEFAFGGVSFPTDLVLITSVVTIAFTYSAAAGISGVLWTDLVQLGIALISIYVLFFSVFDDIGWDGGLRDRLRETGTVGGKDLLELVPPFSFAWIFYLVLQPILFQGGYQPGIQKMLSARSEKDVVLSLVAGVFSNFVFKSIPFYVLGLASVLVISDQYLLDNYVPLLGADGIALPDFEKAFPALVREYLPAGMLGLMVATLLCAFMSSFDSNIHMVGTFFSNDLYRPYLVKEKGEKHYVGIARLAMVVATASCVAIGFLVNDILWLTFFAVSITLSGGWVKLLRWIWWRVNGRSEVAAQIYSFFATIYILSPLGQKWVGRIVEAFGLEGNDSYYVIQTTVLAASSTVVSLMAILLTPPEPMEKLCSFYRRVKPYGWWGPVREALGEPGLKGDSVWVMTGVTMALIAFLLGGVLFVLTAFLALWSVAWPMLLVAGAGALATFKLLPVLLPGESQ
ncbi:hypothetical protein QEH56_14785 [Pelagicoccus enzymogenes]|uniref:sodium:solute symporter family transporter n=1 Tax=Pelagicoccus enzymogenes TaxID=2773457 RepID=UPI00280DF9B0|nr:hypothetical protein [Pelagicoccus enzymogenes]MDQ8199430.1 hypothetical protein [Pelagicoccus enzymogenes]